METKPRVPPFREVDKLLELKAEKEKMEELAAIKAKKREENGNQSDEDENKYKEKEDPHKYDILQMYDFPTYMDKTGPK